MSTILGVRKIAPEENCIPRSGSGFGLGLALELALGAIFLEPISYLQVKLFIATIFCYNCYNYLKNS